MLSNETAMGAHPVAAVATMARIIESAETGRKTGSSEVHKWAGKQSGRFSRALCEAAAFAAEEMSIQITAVFTESGLMARRLAALRPDQRIIALTPSKDVQNELSLIWGVEPLGHSTCDSTEQMIKRGERELMEAGIVQKGEMVVLMAGKLSGLGLSRSVKLHEIGDAEGQQ